jgi:hypothetical protein
MEKLNPSGQEGIRHKFTSKMEAEPLRARGDTAQFFFTKWRLKPSGLEGIRHNCSCKMEAEALRARGDTAQIYIQNES